MRVCVRLQTNKPISPIALVLCVLWHLALWHCVIATVLVMSFTPELERESLRLHHTFCHTRAPRGAPQHWSGASASSNITAVLGETTARLIRKDNYRCSPVYRETKTIVAVQS